MEFTPLVTCHDGSTGMAHLTHLPNGARSVSVMPIRQWDEN
jgi:hypothetical protein